MIPSVSNCIAPGPLTSGPHLPSFRPVEDTAYWPLPAAILPLVAVLRQLETLLDAMTDEQYRTSPVAVAASSVGGHVRHCLDHVEAVLLGVECGTVDYDRRRRGTDVETSRDAAREVLRRQMKQLLAIPANSENRPLRLSAIVSSALPPLEADTSVGRELVFVLSHTVHHNALIGVIARALNVPVPERFGYAPSTLAHLERSQCAQ